MKKKIYSYTEYVVIGESVSHQVSQLLKLFGCHLPIRKDPVLEDKYHTTCIVALVKRIILCRLAVVMARY